MTSTPSASDGFSPLFSDAATDHASPAQTGTPGTAQQRSAPNGDHHLLFVDVADADSKPGSGGQRTPDVR